MRAGLNTGYYRSVNLRPFVASAAAVLAGICLSTCTSGGMRLADAGWPPFPASEARAMLSAASSLEDGPQAAAAAREAAEFAYLRDLYAIALDAAELWLAHQDQDVEALALVAALRVALGREDDALAAARTGLIRPGSAAGFMESFTDRLSGTNPEWLGAETPGRVIAQLAEEFPTLPAVRMLAARVALGAGQYDEAQRHADAVLALTPGHDAACAIAATAQLRAGRPDMALARLTEQLALRDSLSLEQSYAMLLLENNQPREALSRIRQLRAGHPDHAELALSEARMLRLLGALRLAEPILLELFARGHENDQVREELGRIALGRGDWLEAVEWYAGVQSAELAPAATEGLVRAFVELDEFDEALAAVAALVRRYPRHAFESLSLAAYALQSAGRQRDALAAYEEGLRYRPGSRQLRMARAQALVDLKQHRRGIRAMEELLDDYPRDSEVLNALGYTLADRGIRLEEAHDHIRLALELAPGSPAIVDSMAWVLYRLGRPREALPLLEQALASLAHPEVAAHLCEVLFELGETDRAAELLRESIERFEDSDLLKSVQKRYLQ